MKINVRLSEPGPFVMKIRADGFPLKMAEIRLPDWNIKADSGFLLLWMLNVFKGYIDMLCQGRTNLTFDVGQKVMEKHGEDIRLFAQYLENTSLMADNLARAATGDRLLFVNVSEDMRYGSLYSVIKESDPSALYLNYDLGFDREKREWGKGQNFMKPHEFLDYLIDNRVGTIVTVNHYLLDRYRHGYGVLLIPVLKKMGIRLVTIENDPPDLRPGGYLGRSFYCVPDWPAFGNLGCLTAWWDTRHQNCNITPIAIPQDYRGKTGRLSGDYRIVVLSNSRWPSVQGMRNYIDSLFESMQNPWSELTVWYMAMRRMILNGDLTEYQRLAGNSRLHQFFWTAAQDLKYQAIKALKTDRPVDVYGDVGWQNVCPEYYRGSLSNRQIEELFQGDDILLLLANCSYTYLDASGPVYDMIRRGCHWINLPVVAKTEPLRGLEAIEYDTPERLNELVSDVGPAFEKAEGSLGFYRELLQSSVNELVAKISGKNQHYTAWGRELVYHELELEKVLDDYTDKNEVMMRVYQGLLKV